MKKSEEHESGTDAVDRYLIEVTSGDERDLAVFARCDTVMALVPKIGDSSDIGWAYDEARHLARKAPGRTTPSAAVPWYRNPLFAWATAATLAVALIVTSLPPGPVIATGDPDTGDGSTTPDTQPVANIMFAPIVISTELAQMLAEIEPVVLLANATPVDARSMAVLPFAEGPNVESPRSSAVADSIYSEVLRQLSAIPGVVLIDAATAAVYSDSDLPPEEIAHQLGVRSVVEGRVDSVNGDIRFELRLTDAAAAGSSIEEAIERPTEELAMLQADIASRVIGALARTRPPIQPNETL